VKEYWDIYNKYRIFQNRTVLRGNTIKEGDYYVCCEVWIKNSKGEMLITQRNPNKKAGGLWEFIGGGVASGETTSQAAVREVQEEIGIDIAESETTYIYEYKHKNYFMDIYLITKDINIKNIALNVKEVIDAKWVAKEELQKLIASGQFVRSVARRYSLLKDEL